MIRFLKMWRGIRPGTVNDTLARNVQDILVTRNLAEWVQPEALQPPVVARVPLAEARPGDGRGELPPAAEPTHPEAKEPRPRKRRSETLATGFLT